jgi:transposase InsO family protein
VPRLLATAPSQVWTWDVTTLPGPIPWCWYSLYLLLDLYSRYVTGWLIADRETAVLTTRLIAASCRAHCREVFRWYDHAHHHSGIALMTPADVHFGRQDATYAVRERALTEFWLRYPERFVHGPPTPQELPAAAWIDPPVPVDAPTEEVLREFRSGNLSQTR